MADQEHLQPTQPGNEEPAPKKPARYSNNALIFRAIAAGYLIYLGYKMVKDNLEAPAEGFLYWMSYVFAAVFVIVGAFLLFNTWQHYRRNKAEDSLEDSLPEPADEPDGTQSAESDPDDGPEE